MNIIIGGGLAGTYIAKEKGGIILEEQPYIGGLFAISFKDLNITLVPPLVKDRVLISKFFNSVKFSEFRPQIIYEKEKYLKDKVCDVCDELPQWLSFDTTIYNIENPSDIIYSNNKVIFAHPVLINSNDRKIITNRGNVIEYDKIYNTGSRLNLNKLLGISENLGYISLFNFILILKHKDTEWNIYINGSAGIIFSYIIKTQRNNLDIYYVYSFFKWGKKLPDIYRVLGDLKRLKIINRDDILAYRSHVIKEAILYGETIPRKLNGIEDCGRLGLWKNFSIEESLNSIHTC